MNTNKSTFFQIIKRKEFLLFPIIIITGTSLFGWLSGKMGLASFSGRFIPIPLSSAMVFIALSILFLINIYYEKSRLIKSLASLFVIVIAFYCSLIFLDFLFNFKWDAENIFLKNPGKYGNVLTGRMSPIASFLFVIICLGLLSIRRKDSTIIKYLGGSLSLFACVASSVLLIGYLYNAPLLYGSQVIPVSLPSAICFLLFCITLLRVFELQFWTFNLIKNNKVTRQLLKSFLPIVIFIVILQGFLDTVYSFNDINPPLTAAIILLTVVLITVFIVFRVSAIIGAQLLRAEGTIRESEKQLIKLNADKNRFISILGHDLRSPFNVLVSYTELLLEDIHKLDINEIENRLRKVDQAANNTFNLLEDILMWARAQSGKIPFEPQKLIFMDVCDNILETLIPNADAKKITINYFIAKQIIVYADINMLKMVLRNLVSNAIKFTNPGGAINIVAEENPGSVTISVSDNGIGIKPDNVLKLFDISQVLTTKGTEEETGTGLGLLICKDFVEKHRGKIWVESEYGKGSEFKFTLPSFTGEAV